MTDDGTRCHLHQIARALDVPVSFFMDGSATPPWRPPLLASPEVVEILELLAQITDPEVLRECIAFIRKIAIPS